MAESLNDFGAKFEMTERKVKRIQRTGSQLKWLLFSENLWPIASLKIFSFIKYTDRIHFDLKRLRYNRTGLSEICFMDRRTLQSASWYLVNGFVYAKVIHILTQSIFTGFQSTNEMTTKNINNGMWTGNEHIQLYEKKLVSLCSLLVFLFKWPKSECWARK